MASALQDGKKTTGYSFDPNDLYIYGIDLDADEDSPLVEDDKTRLKIDPALVRNIAHRGVVQSITIRVINDHPVVVDGRRRVLHARKANDLRALRGEEALPVRCFLEKGGDSPEAKLTAITANSFRKDHGPMAQARKIASLINAGVDEETIAVSFGFSRSTVGNRLKLVDLEKSVQRALEGGHISFMTALELHGLEAEEQVEACAELMKEGGPKKGQVNRAKGKGRGPKEDTPPERPTLSLLRKLLETEAVQECSEDTVRVLRWVTGELKTPNTIDGLAAAVREASGKKKAPPREE